MFYIRFFNLKNERFAHSLFFGEQCERIAQVAHQNWAMWANRSGCSPKMSDVSKSLRLLTKNERPWAIRSGRSEEMSDVSESLISLTKNERMSDSLKKFWLKKSKILFFSMFYIQFFYWKNERIAHFLFFGERCEWIAQVTHQKWAM